MAEPASSKPETTIELPEQRFQERFQGYGWGIDDRGLTIIIRPLWAHGTEVLGENARNRATEKTTNNFIAAYKDTPIAQCYLASQCVRLNRSHGLPIPEHSGEWLVYMGPTDATEQTKEQDIPIVLLYGRGKSIRIDDGQTILRICFGFRLWSRHDLKGADLYQDLHEVNDGTTKCVWCGRSRVVGDHNHAFGAIKAREILQRFIE